MSNFGRLHRATAIIPLAVLSAAWTASLAGVGVGSASADPDGSGTLPDGTVLPASAIEAPASVGDTALTRAAALTPGAASSIPQAALAAYQRAEAVINKADAGCALPWELIAAIGRVESDHGRFGGNTLDDDGVARPGIYGIALNGKNNTQDISDTDAGQYDNDTRHDRAVGPMQFIPSTWTVVGVDGDSDGTRNPQDIDDAALATAVYLCSGDDDLSSEKGQRASVYRYNHSNDYVDLVLSIMQSYMDGDFSAVPTSTLTSGVILPDPTASADGSGDKGGDGGKGDDKGDKGGDGGKDDNTPTATPTPTPTTVTPTPTTTQTPTPTPSPTPTSSPTPTKDPTTAVPTATPTLPVPTTLPPLPTATITETLTLVQATAQCVAQGVIDNPLTGTNELLDCANKLLAP
ncbi:Transglycosylase SLT domain-containing protein [Nocardioides alpinus]|uniref:Transglycosylase SLT domain-containing protein n=1 Tax=Nocardioides alpinus TaxID=748909 RepID=A0A1I1AQE5_9ACTN|nr:lytic murein transglycosylase [Nocardioides alpinus]SFB40265.1 Transglycosylase SLT domain-containing protein [Nocardioides alpinus]